MAIYQYSDLYIISQQDFPVWIGLHKEGKNETPKKTGKTEG